MKRFLLLLPLLAVGCSHCPVCGGEWGAAERARRAAEEAARAPEPASVSGSVACLERVTILPTYRIRVRLVNLRTGETVRQLEETGFASFPWPFTIDYDLRSLRRGDPHGLAAEILAEDTVLFRTDTQYPLSAERNAVGAHLVLVRKK